MSHCSENKTPLPRAGTDRNGRPVPALSPSTVKIIDKSPPDWMVWAARLAERVRFYDLANQVAGSMAPFFANDVAARLAAQSTYEPVALPEFFREQLLVLQESDPATEVPQLQAAYTMLYDVLFSYFAILDRQYLLISGAKNSLGSGLSAASDPALTDSITDYLLHLKNHTTQRLLPAIQRAVGYHMSSDAAGLFTAAGLPPISIFQSAVVSTSKVLTDGLSELWWQSAGSWAAWLATVAADDTIFGNIAATPGEKIQHASRHNFFTGLLDEITASASYVIALSKRAIDRLLQDWPNHQPQYALFLAWLLLMENARGEMNRLSGRHLTFYYRDVLRMQMRPAQADSAFLSVELNKATASYALPRGTEFLGGKDESGGDVIFASERETVLGKAVVSELKAVYMDDTDGAGGKNAGRVFAAPVINSADGLGTALETELKEWHPFSIETTSDTGVSTIVMPKAEIGFAFASRYLRLQEGKRAVELRIALDNVAAFVTHADLDVYLTAEKSWLAAGATIASGTLSNGTTPAAVITIPIGADQPAVTAYNAAVHGHTFATTEPVLKLVLRHDDTETYPYAALAPLRIGSFEIRVQVGDIGGAYSADGLKNLELHNDLGLLNPAKPFMPWGAEPTIGNSFIIGSEELARKPGATVQFNFEWKDLPAEAGDLDFDYDASADYHSIPSTNGPYNPEVDISSLESGTWVPRASGKNLFPVTDAYELIPTAACIAATGLTGAYFIGAEDEYPGYSAGSQRGYFRIRLKHDFGHRNYHAALVDYLLKKGNNPNSTLEEWAAPYQPVLQSFRLSYAASCNAGLPAAGADEPEADIQFLHLAPFGDALQYLPDDGGPALLLPQVAEGTGGTATARGELYIGFSSAVPGQSISLLVQVMDGSENPLREKPDEHLHWSYLSGNTWKDLGDGVNDETMELIASGIIEIAVPTDATTDNTLLPAGSLWIKCAVTEAPDAVCKIIGVFTNAVRVTRLTVSGKQGSAPFVAAGTISKLRTPVTAVKKALQPYDSFGGAAPESDADYYQRVSERLRHKDRAITIWDYERIVLEAFPEIFLVKCLNHTSISGSAADGTLEYNEVAPGHVTIITVPDLADRHDADPLRPYTRTSLLESIAAHLAERTTCHAHVTAAQPQFEAVRIACRVVLAEGYDDIPYYTELLQNEVTQFLSPWAFGASTGISFGGSLWKSVVIDFIEERPYVDFITDVQMFVTPGENAVEGGDVDQAVASTARSILVSAPASTHAFIVERAEEPVLSEQCDA